MCASRSAASTTSSNLITTTKYSPTSSHTTSKRLHVGTNCSTSSPPSNNTSIKPMHFIAKSASPPTVKAIKPPNPSKPTLPTSKTLAKKQTLDRLVRNSTSAASTNRQGAVRAHTPPQAPKLSTLSLNGTSIDTVRKRLVNTKEKSPTKKEPHKQAPALASKTESTPPGLVATVSHIYPPLTGTINFVPDGVRCPLCDELCHRKELEAHANECYDSQNKSDFTYNTQPHETPLPLEWGPNGPRPPKMNTKLILWPESFRRRRLSAQK